MLKSNFDLVGGKLWGAVLLFKISENLLECKPFKTSRKLPYFEKNQLFMCLPNLHTAPKSKLQYFVSP